MQRREKQGDAWYSVRLADGTYAQVLRIPKGERVPEIKEAIGCCMRTRCPQRCVVLGGACT
ncbi:MAG: hypothetical protein R6W76_01265 [Caldilinea sp.]